MCHQAFCLDYRQGMDGDKWLKKHLKQQEQWLVSLILNTFEMSQEMDQTNTCHLLDISQYQFLSETSSVLVIPWSLLKQYLFWGEPRGRWAEILLRFLWSFRLQSTLACTSANPSCKDCFCVLSVPGEWPIWPWILYLPGQEHSCEKKVWNLA